jgi:hypothetical protein
MNIDDLQSAARLKSGELAAVELAAGSRANRQARRLPYVGQASSLPDNRASCPVLVPESGFPLEKNACKEQSLLPLCLGSDSIANLFTHVSESRSPKPPQIPCPIRVHPRFQNQDAPAQYHQL